MKKAQTKLYKSKNSYRGNVKKYFKTCRAEKKTRKTMKLLCFLCRLPFSSGVVILLVALFSFHGIHCSIMFVIFYPFVWRYELRRSILAWIHVALRLWLLFCLLCGNVLFILSFNSWHWSLHGSMFFHYIIHVCFSQCPHFDKRM